MTDDENFYYLIDRFHSSVEDVQNVLKNVDFLEMTNGFPQLPILKLYLVLLQHASYHIGQLITVRKCLNDWPPK